jgi:hypothetical protein
MSGNFLPSVQAAAFNYYVLGNGSGTDKTYNGQGYYLLDTDFWAYFDRIDVTTVAVATAIFASGTVSNGQVMQFVVVPEPGAIMLAAAGIAIVIAGRRNRYESGATDPKEGTAACISPEIQGGQRPPDPAGGPSHACSSRDAAAKAC